MRNVGASDRRNWAKQVLKQLTYMVSAGDKIVILAGKDYRENLINPLGFNLQEQPGSKLENTMRGFWKSRHFRGREFKLSFALGVYSNKNNLSSVIEMKLEPFGKYWRMRPLVFSFVPLSQEA